MGRLIQISINWQETSILQETLIKLSIIKITQVNLQLEDLRALCCLNFQLLNYPKSMGCPVYMNREIDMWEGNLWKRKEKRKITLRNWSTQTLFQARRTIIFRVKSLRWISPWLLEFFQRRVQEELLENMEITKSQFWPLANRYKYRWAVIIGMSSPYSISKAWWSILRNWVSRSRADQRRTIAR